MERHPETESLAGSSTKLVRSPDAPPDTRGGAATERPSAADVARIQALGGGAVLPLHASFA